MEIPVTLFGVLVAGLLAAYVAISYRLFHFSREVETDFDVVVRNLKTRELNKIKEFIEAEISSETWAADSNVPLNRRPSRDHKVRELMEERWKNAYSCYQAEGLVGELQRREAAGQKWCIIGIICIVVSFVVYLLPSVSMDTLKICLVLLLCFFPLVIIAYFFFGNVSLRRDIRNLKKDIEKIWQF